MKRVDAALAKLDKERIVLRIALAFDFLKRSERESWTR
jgi:hypothetical protein